jgi:hypothetical protein
MIKSRIGYSGKKKYPGRVYYIQGAWHCLLCAYPHRMSHDRSIQQGRDAELDECGAIGRNGTVVGL